MTTLPTDAELQARADKLGAVYVNESKLKGSIKKVDFYVHPDSQLTVCIVTLLNGYTVTGESACADPKMFDKEIGEKFAFAAAERKIWPLLAYALKDELFKAGQGTTFQDRVRQEATELHDKLNKLTAFVSGTAQFERLPEEDRALLTQQQTHMWGYLDALQRRIERF